MENIHPIFDSILSGKDKEKLLNQKAKVFWLIGLSGSGKSTLARALEHLLFDAGYKTVLLDGDNLRTGVNNNLGFSEEDRIENIRRAAEVARLFADNGLITICSLISPTHDIQEMTRNILGEHYFEIFIDCPLEVCETRDVKGLYAKARKGLITNFTGIDSPFNAPQNPELVIKTGEQSEEVSLNRLKETVFPLVKLN